MKLPVAVKWTETKLGNKFQILRRKDGSLIIKIEGKNCNVQADLDYVIDKFVMCDQYD